MRQIKDMDDAIDEQSDLIRELGRTPECVIRVEEAQNVLEFMEKVREKSLQYKDLQELLDVQ